MRLDKLDLVRGVAALAVFLGHARALLFVDYGQSTQRNPLLDAFYALTGFGHQAVVVFFVLSGFLIGGAVRERFVARRWSFGDYALRRLTRLWVVLVPALFFTMVWDLAGSWLGGNAGYDGRYYEMSHLGPAPNAPADGGLMAFLGNMFFVQTILVPPYGTNGPLWSLANEFWYYLMFPLAYAACSATIPRWSRVFCLALLIAVGLFLPGHLLLGGILWLAGYAAFILTRSRLGTLAASGPFFWGAFAVLMGVLAYNRWRALPYADYWIALAFAAMLPRLAADRGGSHWWRKPARYFGATSYTLYLCHFPLLAFLAFTLLKGKHWQPGIAGFTWYVVVAAIVLGWTHLAWWLFERRTDDVRSAVSGWVRGRRLQA